MRYGVVFVGCFVVSLIVDRVSIFLCVCGGTSGLRPAGGVRLVGAVGNTPEYG